MAATATTTATTAECGCGGACDTVNAYCKHCKVRGDFHVVEGDVNPILYWTCEAELHTFEQHLMSGAEILRESRRGGWH